MDLKLLEKSEHAKWVQKKNVVNEKYSTESQKLFNNSAARGFSQPPASVLEDILTIGRIVKTELTNINSAIYGDSEDIVFQDTEHNLKLATEYARIEFALYNQQVLNALEIEVANMNDLFSRDKTDVDRFGDTINLRQKDLILQKAEVDQQITDDKIEIVEAERSVLGKDIELLNAKIETAEIQLTIIDSLREVIAAEQLIVDAERRKAVALETLIGVETEIAAIKESMIPYYMDLADAKKLLASAIEQEANDKMALARLQIDRAQLKIDQANNFAEEQDHNGSLVLAQRNYDNATAATQQYQRDAQRILSEEQSSIKRELITLDEELKKRGIDLDFDYQEEKNIIAKDAQIEKYRNQLDIEANNLSVHLRSMREIADSKKDKLIASRSKKTDIYNTTQFDHHISSG